MKRRLGGAWTLDRVWERLGIGAALRTAAAGRRLDGELTERVLFALVAQRALEPGSKLAATTWVGERVVVDGLGGLGEDQAYRGMDFLLSALPEIAEGIFTTTAHLLNLSCDIVFVDTSSTYFQTGTADELAAVAAAEDAEARRAAEKAGAESAVGGPAQAGTRRFGHSKDHRDDLPQVVIGMAVTAEGVPVRCWTFPGNTSDQLIIRTVKDDLGSWSLRRVVWVGDRGFNSVANRGLPGSRRRALHPGREAARRLDRSPASAGPGRALPHRGGQPAGQGGPGR